MLQRRRCHFLASQQPIDQVEDAVPALIGTAAGITLRVERDGDRRKP